jgi:hypothetical protein
MTEVGGAAQWGGQLRFDDAFFGKFSEKNFVSSRLALSGLSGRTKRACEKMVKLSSWSSGQWKKGKRALARSSFYLC